MEMLHESNLLAMKAKAAKFRTHHVGTKLNEAELHEFETLAEKRGLSSSGLIRGLVLDEIERDIHRVGPFRNLQANRSRSTAVVSRSTEPHHVEHAQWECAV